MSTDEMRRILAGRLAKFRAWSHAQLAERVVRDGQTGGCLDHIEGTAPDGTEYQMEFQAMWKDQPGGAVVVLGDFSASPQRPLWGFIPIYTPNVTDSFILSPDGGLMGGPERNVADAARKKPRPTLETRLFVT
ncbi:MAG TPA: hypothetical protein DDZ88_03765 [Verrucomicrobiales bacterium]|nr:hypothetical protein [Verrucomicrobiales bacterium]